MENTNQQPPPPPLPVVQNNGEKPSSKYKILGIISILLGIFSIPVILFYIYIYIFYIAFAPVPVLAILFFLMIITFCIINFFIGVKLLKKSVINKNQYFKYSIISAVLTVFLVFLPTIFLVFPLFSVSVIGIQSSPKMNITIPNLIEPSITPSPTPTINISDTSTPDKIGANWKTYTNEKYGFSFKYPSDGIVEVFIAKSFITGKDASSIYITPPLGHTYEKSYVFQIEVENNTKNLSARGVIDDYLNRLINNKGGPGMKETANIISQTIKPYTNGNINGLIGTYGSETEFALLVEAKNNKIYSFSIHDGNGYTNDYVLKIFDQILSTFKFLE